MVKIGVFPAALLTALLLFGAAPLKNKGTQYLKNKGTQYSFLDYLVI